MAPTMTAFRLTGNDSGGVAGAEMFAAELAAAPDVAVFAVVWVGGDVGFVQATMSSAVAAVAAIPFSTETTGLCMG